MCTLQSRVAVTTSAALLLPLLPHIHPAHAPAETAQVSISPLLKLIKGWKRRSWCQYLLPEARGSGTWQGARGSVGLDVWGLNHFQALSDSIQS